MSHLQSILQYGFVPSTQLMDQMILYLPAWQHVYLPPGRRQLVDAALRRSKPRTFVVTSTGIDDFVVTALRIMVEPTVDSYFYTRIHGYVVLFKEGHQLTFFFALLSRRSSSWYPSKENEIRLVNLLHASCQGRGCCCCC